ncbi:MAG TPA: hypothetical protein VN081_01135 [Dongiaceae bacterium]|nr:hypothetical protein [Dongiaceae bacterium]
MFENLDAYLANVTTPDLRATLMDACEFLVTLGVEGHSFAIDQELAMAGNGDTQITVHSIYSVVTETVRAIMDRMGVITKNDQPLHRLLDALKALEGLTNYDDQATVAQLLDENQDPEEALGAVLALLGTHKPHDYVELFAEVSEDLLIRLKTLNSAEESYDLLPSRENVELARSRFKRFLVRHKNTLIEAKIRDGARIGVPVDDLIDQIGDPIHDLSGKDFGIVIAGAYAASNTPTENLQEAARREVTKFSTDISFITQANLAITQALLEV